MNFLELQDEVKRRATRNQSGTQYDQAAKNAINSSLLRISREALWRVLRRTGSFNTQTSYTTGSGSVSVTNASKNFSITGATLLTDKIQKGRRVKFGTDSRVYEVDTITGEETGTITRDYDGTTSTTTTYEIYPKQEYNLPPQAGHRMFMYHEQFGDPFMLKYITELEFKSLGVNETDKGTPTHYRMWGEDMAEQQPVSASTLSISSSDSDDTAKDITIYGIVAGYPDFETIRTNNANGTTAVAGLKSFTSVERVVKSQSIKGRITITSNSGNITVATLPAGNTTTGIIYRKIKLWPLPDDVFPLKVLYYKDIFKLVNDLDVHELGDAFDEAITLLSVSKLKYEQNQKEGDRFFSLYVDELKSLKRVNVDKIDWLPTLKKPNEGTFGHRLHKNLLMEQLGGNFGIRVS